MNKFLEPDHPDAFVDWTKMAPKPDYGMSKECPRCKGHGGWNLTLNAYRLPAEKANTSENRHSFVHFRCVCNHCNGWGYVEPTETCDGHEWAYEANLGRCYNRYRCSKCGRQNDVDSSD